MSTLTETAPSLTPSASVHDDIWDFAVPVDLDNHARSSRQGPASSSLKSRTASYPINGDATLMHNRINGYNSRSSDTVSITRNKTEAPAFIDNIKSSSVHRNNSAVSPNDDEDPVFDLHSTHRMSSVPSTTPNSDPPEDDSKWINRDKLAQIENQDLMAAKWIDRDKLLQIESKEMAQAGILLPVKGTRGSAKLLETHSKQVNTEPQKQQIPSPPSDNSRDSEDDQEDKFFNSDPRHPAEIAMDCAPNPSRQTLKNGSKIPLSVTSPIPVRQKILERTAPLIRQSPSEQGSDEDETSGSYARLRKRSYSASSAVVLNGDSESNSTATSAKPTKVTRSQTQPVAAMVSPGRKKSTQAKRATNTNLGKSRSKSNPQLTGTRPGTASPTRDSGSQPGSSGKNHPHVPDGPPPWSLSSYTPDPKLPPEEQLIPTVAKRLQQEQWEKEGKFATVYDGKLRPLKVEESIDPNKSQYKHQRDESSNTFPPKTPSGNSETPPHREERQEKPISRIPNGAPQISPKIPRSNSSSNGPGLRVNGIETTIIGPSSKQGTNVPDTEKKKEKSKFCCCIVM